MYYWMIHPSYESRIQQVFGADLDAAQLAAVEPTAAEPLDTIDGVARIEIRGVLMPQRDRWLDMFGIPHTAYSDILAQLREAESSLNVRGVELRTNSGGGVVDNAIVEIADFIHSMTKPVTAVVEDMAASAAYWITSQADEIVLQGEMSRVGSIGVAIDTFAFDHEVSIASTDAPKKRPDVRTEAGKAIVRSELDDIHKVFVAAVARGRGVSAEIVSRDFGQGGVLMANAAIAADMADRLLSATAAPTARGTLQANMDRETLKREHAALFDSIKLEGAAEAKASERDRVSAHLVLAEASGCHKEALAYIADGRGITDIVIATHNAARMNATNEAARVAAAPGDVTPTPVPTVVPTATQVEQDCDALFDEMQGISA